jgi:hypothetical protein
MKCFMAEGVCCKHSVAWVTAQQLTPESTAAFLPDQARSGSSSSSGQVGQTTMHRCTCTICVYTCALNAYHTLHTYT